MILKHKLAGFLILVTVPLIYLLYVGYYTSSIDHEEHRVYFVKTLPTFRQFFLNPFANEGDPMPIANMDQTLKNEFHTFCRYAYGINHDDNDSLELCREHAVNDAK